MLGKLFKKQKETEIDALQLAELFNKKSLEISDSINSRTVTSDDIEFALAENGPIALKVSEKLRRERRIDEAILVLERTSGGNRKAPAYYMQWAKIYRLLGDRESEINILRDGLTRLRNYNLDHTTTYAKLDERLAKLLLKQK